MRPRHEPDLHEPLNRNQGVEAHQPDIRDRLNEQWEQARPLGYPPAMPIVPVANPMMDMYNQLAAEVQALRANQEQARAGRAYAHDSDEELEPFAPHISNTPFPPGFKISHVAMYDGTTDPGSHLITFNTVLRASNVRLDLRCILFPTTLTGPAKSWFDKFRRHSITSWD